MTYTDVDAAAKDVAGAFASKADLARVVIEVQGTRYDIVLSIVELGREWVLSLVNYHRCMTVLPGIWHAPTYVAEKLGVSYPDANAISEFLDRVRIHGRIVLDDIDGHYVEPTEVAKAVLDELTTSWCPGCDGDGFVEAEDDGGPATCSMCDGEGVL